MQDKIKQNKASLEKKLQEYVDKKDSLSKESEQLLDKESELRSKKDFYEENLQEFNSKKDQFILEKKEFYTITRNKADQYDETITELKDKIKLVMEKIFNLE